jgi:hypothetical protein
MSARANGAGVASVARDGKGGTDEVCVACDKRPL